MLSYEVPVPKYDTSVINSTGEDRSSSTNQQIPSTFESQKSLSVTVYNFHSLISQARLFLFTSDLSSHTFERSTNLTSSVTAINGSVSELFFSANWLEREVSELHGILFSGKKDLRNLMLQYGDSSSPFQKAFPTVGLKELYYNPIKDTLVQSPISLQL
jgi:NADH:ubiquinone oxidoreductase subunit C